MRQFYRSIGFSAVAIAAVQFIIARYEHERDRERSTDLIVSEARRQIDLQYSSSDAHGLLTLGWIAAGIAGAAIVISKQSTWEWWWLIPIASLATSVASYIVSLRNQPFQRGPNLAEFYEQFSGTAFEAKAAILSQLFVALDHNDSLLPRRQRWYRVAGWALFVSCLSTIPVWLHVAVG